MKTAVGGFDVGVEFRAAPGFVACGDGWTVKDVKDGVLVCVVDGLGHGDDAAVAADAALAVVGDHAEVDLKELIEKVHAAIKRTRGCVMALVRIGPDGVRWLGVGNIDALVVRAGSRDALVCRGGVVGYKLPALKVSTTSFSPGDTLVLTTDGVAPGGEGEALVPGLGVGAIAERVLKGFVRGDDDALVCVVRHAAAEVA